MKKIAALLLLIVTTLPCMAQYGRVTGTGFANEHNLYYGIRLGWSLAAISSNVETVEAGTLKSGLHLGGVIGFQLSSEHPVYLESGLSYIEKGGKGDYKGEKHTYSLKYLLLPIVVKYRYELDDAFSVQPFVYQPCKRIAAVATITYKYVHNFPLLIFYHCVARHVEYAGIFSRDAKTELLIQLPCALICNDAFKMASAFVLYRLSYEF